MITIKRVVLLMVCPFFRNLAKSLSSGTPGGKRTFYPEEEARVR